MAQVAHTQWSTSDLNDLANVVATPIPVLGRRTPQFRAASTIQNFQSGHGWSLNGTGVTGTVNDTATFCRGTQSAKIITNGSGAQSNLRIVGGSAVDLTNKAIRLTFKVSDVTHLSKINFFIGTTTFTNFYRWFVHTRNASGPNLVQSGEWVTITLEMADIQGVGGTDTLTNGVPTVTSGFTDLQFQVVDDNTGNAVTVNLQSFEVVASSKTNYGTGVVSIVFDDGYQSVWDYAKPRLDLYGYRGTMYVIAENIGSSSLYLTLAELTQMKRNSGWEIAGHAYGSAVHAAGLTAYSSTDVVKDLGTLKTWLLQYGFDSDSFAYPSGLFDKTTDSVNVDDIVSRFFTTGRTTIGGMANDNLESFPPPNPMRLRSATGVSALNAGALPASIVATGGWLDRCLNDGNWLILTFHKITTGAATVTTECAQTDFNTIIDGINTRGIPVVPVGDVMRTA